MIPEELEGLTWPMVVLLVVGCLIWGWNVHADRQNAHDLDLEIVKTCTYADGSGEGTEESRRDAVQACADRMRDAL